MSNEELAILIQRGDNDELLPLLFDKVKGVIYQKAAAEYSTRRSSFAKCGYELSDLRQEAYEIFLCAVRAYNPERSESLVTYLNFPLLNKVHEMIGTRSGRANRKPLDNCISLDEPINNAEDGSPITLSDVIPDTDESPEEKIVKLDLRRVVRTAVYSLDEPYHSVISRHYFCGHTYQIIADDMNLSAERVRQLCKKGLSLLKQNEQIKQVRCIDILSKLEKRIKQREEIEKDRQFKESAEYAKVIEESKGLSYGMRQAAIYEARQKFEKAISKGQNI